MATPCLILSSIEGNVLVLLPMPVQNDSLANRNGKIPSKNDFLMTKHITEHFSLNATEDKTGVAIDKFCCNDGSNRKQF